MTILNSPPPSPEGFSWNIRISEKVLVTLFVVGASFGSGIAIGQSSRAEQVAAQPQQTATQPSALPPACPAVAPTTNRK